MNKKAIDDIDKNVSGIITNLSTITINIVMVDLKTPVNMRVIRFYFMDFIMFSLFYDKIIIYIRTKRS